MRIPQWLVGAVAVLVYAWNSLHGAVPGPAAQCRHTPQQPRSGEPVLIQFDPGRPMREVRLEYQPVDPGRYIARSSPAYRAQWPSVAMTRDESFESAYRVELPGTLQTHRRLVRYRVRGVAEDGSEFRWPPESEAQTNFGYFTYDGIPEWKGAINPRGRNATLRNPVTYGSNVMNRVQSYHFIANSEAVENVTWREQATDDEYRYTGTLVVDGIVYDHTRFRARGGVWRYAMGKNMWKFDLPRGQPLAARDDYGRQYSVPWRKVNLRACIQQGDYGYRGEQGMFESVGFRLFELAGVSSPYTHWIQLRIISEESEAPANQYRGDYWGLYLAFEDVDEHFLERHNLPDGNVYKMENGTGSLSGQGGGAPSDGSDLQRFLLAYNRRSQSEEWWRGQLDLPSYYSYRAICEAIHHYDIADGKNYSYYLNPKSGRWQVIPWDIDLTWADTMYGSGNEPFLRPVLSKPAFRLEYSNRLREIRDLLYNNEEAGRLIDECAAIIADPAGGPSPVDADRAKWDFHPQLAMGGKAGHGLFYQIAPDKSFKGMVQLMKDYVRRRSAWIDSKWLRDANLPTTPAIEYTGPEGYASDQITFRSSEYQGPGEFAEMQWRVAEVSLPARDAAGRPTSPGRYEITAVWESERAQEYVPEITVPAECLKPGHTYRARVRMKNAAGSWSHWSRPVQFAAGAKK